MKKEASCLFRLGEDAEVFLQKKRTKELVSAIPIFPHGKGRPKMLPCRRGGVIHDNVLVETNTKPASSLGEWIENNSRVMADVRKIADKWGTRIRFAAALRMPDEAIQDIEARMFGCDPDLNAWTLAPNDTPDAVGAGNLRSAGGHLHIGVGTLSQDFNRILLDRRFDVVRLLDVALAVPSVILDDLEGTDERRQLYGKAGAMRMKPYGVEYRTLSPWWKQSTRTLRTIYEMVERAANWIAEGSFEVRLHNLLDDVGGPHEIQRVINTGDVIGARDMCRVLDEEGLLTRFVGREVGVVV